MYRPDKNQSIGVKCLVLRSLWDTPNIEGPGDIHGVIQFHGF